MYDKARSDERLTLKTGCQLDANGMIYDALIDNISTVGASIEIAELAQKDIKVGDTGTLHVLLLSPVQYLCKVVRIDANQIGLQFVDN
jgi:hypothetical protein